MTGWASGERLLTETVTPMPAACGAGNDEALELRIIDAVPDHAAMATSSSDL